MEFDDGPLIPEKVHHLVGGGLPIVGDVGLVGHAHHKDAASHEGNPRRVQGFHQPVDHVVGHAAVDLSGQLDEAGVDVVFPGLPGEVVGVERDAVPTDPGSGVEGHEAEGLGLGGLDDLPDIDPHRGVDPFQFIHEGDVDEAEDVLGEFHRLCGVATTHGDDTFDGLGVEGHGPFQAGGGDASHDLWHVAQEALGIARILPFRREGEAEVDPGLEPGSLLQDLAKVFARGAGIGARLQGDEHSRAEVRCDLASCIQDEADIGIEVSSERGGYADDDCLARGEISPRRGECQEPFGGRRGDPLRRNRRQGGVARLQAGDPFRVDVEAEGAASCLCESDRERDADVAEAEYGDVVEEGA